jgi:hypothetical protein
MRKQASDETSFHVAVVIPVGSPGHLLRAESSHLASDRFHLWSGLKLAIASATTRSRDRRQWRDCLAT